MKITYLKSKVFCLLIFTVYFFTIITQSTLLSAEPEIIYLKGSFSAGKSTLINTIKQHFEDVAIVDEDEILYAYYPRFFAEKFPEEYQIILNGIDELNIFRATRTEDVLFKPTAFESDRISAKEAISEILRKLDLPCNTHFKKEINNHIDSQFLQTIQSALHDGKAVLIDTWHFNAKQIQELFPEYP